jgi:Tol biopolymer transport system component
MVEPRFGTTNLWVHDLSRGISKQLTVEAGTESSPVWSPDDSRILFSGDADAPQHLFVKALDGTDATALKLTNWQESRGGDWSLDGRFIAYSVVDPKSGRDLWVLPLFGDRKPYAFLQTPFNEGGAVFSPDGRFIAYVSNESGVPDVYVQPFPGPGARRRISTASGTTPRWRQDGKEIFYLSKDHQVMAVPVNLAGATLESGPPKSLFRIESTGVTRYDVSADGQRILVAAGVEGWEPPITVVVNWTAGLKR